MNDIPLGFKIKYFRKLKGLTQKQLASLTGIHPVSIRKYETHLTTPKLPHLEKICNVLTTSIFAIIDFQQIGLINAPNKPEDVWCLLFALNVIEMDGERDDEGLLKSSTVSIKLNRTFAKWVKTCEVSQIDKSIITNLLQLERLRFWQSVGALGGISV